jgi:hypothetical protein
VEDVAVFRKVRVGGVVRRPMHPSIDGAALLKIRIEGGAKLTVPSGRLLAALRLAVIEVHGEILARIKCVD